jgi:hypothetical protein
MNDATIIAVVTLVGIFLILIVAMLKSGIDGLIRLWSVMGAIIGLILGGITSHYFTNQYNQQQISLIKADNQILSSSLAKAAYSAAKATKNVNSIEFALTGEAMSSDVSDTGFRLSNLIAENDKKELTKRLKETSLQLGYIVDLPRATMISESLKDVDSKPIIPEFK